MSAYLCWCWWEKPQKNLNFWHFFADIKTWAIVVVILLSLFLVFDLIALFGTSKVRTLSIDVSWQRKEKQKVFSILLNSKRPAEKRRFFFLRFHPILQQKIFKKNLFLVLQCSGISWLRSVECLKNFQNVILQFLSVPQNSCKEKFSTTAEFNLAKGGHGKSCLAKVLHSLAFSLALSFSFACSTLGHLLAFIALDYLGICPSSSKIDYLCHGNHCLGCLLGRKRRWKLPHCYWCHGSCDYR